MRTQNRAFAREYKSRSARVLNNSFQESFLQDIRTISKPVTRNFPEHSASSTRSNDLREAAETFFKVSGSDQMLDPSGGEIIGNTKVSGRILPCLSQQIKINITSNDKERRRNNSFKGDKSSLLKKRRLTNTSDPTVRTSNHLSASSNRSKIVSEEFSKLSDLEILSLIERAKQEIAHRKNAGRERLKEEIQAKLADSGLDLGDLFPEISSKARRNVSNGSKKSQNAPVPAKYRDPTSNESWSGRGGRPPHWVKKIMDEKGWTLEDFKNSGDYQTQTAPPADIDM